MTTSLDAHTPSALRHALTRLAAQPRARALGCAFLAVVLGIAFGGWWLGIGLQGLNAGAASLLAALRERPLWLFAAIVVLPALPVPASPLLILAGAVFTPRLGLAGAVPLALLAVGLNIAWTYWAAAGPGRRQVDRLLHYLQLQLPVLSHGNALRLAILLRVTPGIPFFLQNLVLGFLRVPFRIYLPVSLATSTLFTTGFVVFGESLSTGNGRLAVLAVGLIVATAVAISLIRGRLSRRAETVVDQR